MISTGAPHPSVGMIAVLVKTGIGEQSPDNQM